MKKNEKIGWGRKAFLLLGGAFIAGAVLLAFVKPAQDEPEVIDDEIAKAAWKQCDLLKREVEACSQEIVGDGLGDGKEEFFGVDFSKSMDGQVEVSPIIDNHETGLLICWRYDFSVTGNQLFDQATILASHRSKMPCKAFFSRKSAHDSDEESKMVDFLLKRFGKVTRCTYQDVLMYSSVGPGKKGESPEWMVEYYPRGDHRCDDIRRQGAFFSFIHPNIDKFADPEDPRSRRGREQRD